MCAPRFDGDPLFGRLVGGPGGGHVPRRSRPCRLASIERRYRPGTATLETDWEIGGARAHARPTEWWPNSGGRLLPDDASGAPPLRRPWSRRRRRSTFDPRVRRTATAPPRAHAAPHGARVQLGRRSPSRSTRHPAFDIEPGRPVTVTVEPGRPLVLVLAVAHHEPLIYVEPDTPRGPRSKPTNDAGAAGPRRIDLRTSRSATRSCGASSRCGCSRTRRPAHRWPLRRRRCPRCSAAIRNWDYRFAWPRDASIGIGAFLGVGKHARGARVPRLAPAREPTRSAAPARPAHIARQALAPANARSTTGPATPTADRSGSGTAPPTSTSSTATAGCSTPHGCSPGPGTASPSETWRAMTGFADRVAQHWREPDAGIWEIRGDAQHHVHSKLMAWLALDRALRIADTRRLWSAVDVDVGRTNATRSRDDVRNRGFDDARGTYTRSYGSDELDAAVLVLPLARYRPPDGPRVRGTIDAIVRELDAGGPLLYRYPPGRDGLTRHRGRVPAVRLLARAGPREARARSPRRPTVSLRSSTSRRPLGLYAEEMDPIDRRAPWQLSPSTHPRGARPGRARHPRRTGMIARSTGAGTRPPQGHAAPVGARCSLAPLGARRRRGGARSAGGEVAHCAPPGCASPPRRVLMARASDGPEGVT